MPRGRPSKYNAEIASDLCEALASGMSLREWCAEDSTRPQMSSIMRWLDKHEEFRQQYARARDIQADYFAEEILSIADDAQNDWMRRQGKDGEEYWVLNGEHVQRSRLRVDSRKWLMSKMAPKKYGDKITNTLEGNVRHDAGEGFKQLLEAIDGRTRSK